MSTEIADGHGCRIRITFTNAYLRRLESDAEQAMQTEFLAAVESLVRERFRGAQVTVDAGERIAFGYFGAHVDAPRGAGADALSRDVRAYLYGAVDQAIRDVTAR